MAEAASGIGIRRRSLGELGGVFAFLSATAAETTDP